MTFPVPEMVKVELTPCMLPSWMFLPTYNDPPVTSMNGCESNVLPETAVLPPTHMVSFPVGPFVTTPPVMRRPDRTAAPPVDPAKPFM